MNYEKIKPYIEKRLISEQIHPEDENVRIFNYTPETQFSKAWDEVTRQCRGLILNIANGEVLARPFPKFFNYQEHIQNGWPVPNETPIITEKLDGSLGILYELNGKQWIATRGSFMSDQAQWATIWWRENIKDRVSTEGVTHLFEIIFPENRIVVNYDYSGLVHLASLDTKTGLQIGATDGRDVAVFPPLRKVGKVQTTDVESLMALDEPNSEGFVIFYPKENVRMKIKFPEYVRLHKIITGVSEIGVWETLREGGNFAPLLEKVPDEFYRWVTETRDKLQKQFDLIQYEAITQINLIFMRMSKEGRDPRTKEGRAFYAAEIKKMTNPAIGFSILSDKDPAPIIWKMIRPIGQHIFKTDLDN